MYDSNLPIASNLYPHRNWEPIFGMTEKTADDIMDALNVAAHKEFSYGGSVVEEIDESE